MLFEQATLNNAEIENKHSIQNENAKKKILNS